MFLLEELVEVDLFIFAAMLEQRVKKVKKKIAWRNFFLFRFHVSQNEIWYTIVAVRS